MTLSERAALIRRVAAMVPASTNDDCVPVGVDGGDGAGKTIFADELAVALEAAGRQVVRVSVDDFHQPQAIRYRRGRTSPDGFWLDSFDLDRLQTDVLGPLGPGGSRRFRRAAHDLATDEPLDPPTEVAPEGAVLVVDGLFLHRDSLFKQWHLSIWLEVPFEVTAQRMAVRDGTNPDPAHPTMARYVGAQQIYRDACDPAGRASIVIDNADPQRPRPLRMPSLSTAVGGRCDARTMPTPKPQHLSPSWADDTRDVPPLVGDEQEILLSYLEYHRATLELKCAGVPEERLSERAIPPSGLSLHGLLRHLAGVERWWFRIQFAGEDLPLLYYSDDDPNQDFDRLDGDVDEAFAVWRRECDAARAIVAAAPSLDATGVHMMSAQPIVLRRIVVSLIAEYARHNGHADLLRERIDGATGS